MATHIYLIPGFMGFRSMGELNYFRRVPDMLAADLLERGVDEVKIIECPTHPSGSIARRSQQVLKRWRWKRPGLGE